MGAEDKPTSKHTKNIIYNWSVLMYTMVTMTPLLCKPSSIGVKGKWIFLYPRLSYVIEQTLYNLLDNDETFWISNIMQFDVGIVS